MPTGTDVLLNFSAVDNVTGVTNKIQSSVKNMGGTTSSAGSSGASSISRIADACGGLDGAITGVLGTMGAQNFGNLIFGTSKTAETNKILIKGLTDTEAEYNTLYNTVDETTNKSLVSMQNLIPAMSNFQASSGATASQLNTNVVPAMADFGQYVLALGYSSDVAQTAMSDLGKGLQGQFASLDQYKVSEQSLKDTGLWSGKADDIEGYMAAIEQVIGGTDELMNTTTGLEALMGKSFSKAGKQLGAYLLPMEKQVLTGFMGINDATGGNLAVGLLAAGEGASVLAQGLGAVGAAAQGIRALSETWHAVSDGISGAIAKLMEYKAAEGGLDVGGDAVGAAASKGAGKVASETGSDVGADVAGNVGGEVAEGIFDKRKSSNTPDMDKRSVNTNSFKNANKNMKGATSGIKGIATETAELAPAAASASATSTASAGALSTLSASISSMLVPMLAVAAVVAIMIPIIAGIAAEVLIFVKGIGMLIQALDFQSMNLTGQINGIKQIGTAMWELAKAFGAITLVSVEAVIFSAVQQFTQIINPIQVAVNQVKKAVSAVNQLGAVGNINSSIPAKLKMLSTSLRAVAIAIMSMTAVTGSLFLGQVITLHGIFGSLSSNLKNGMKDIKNAISEINNMKGIQSVDTGAVNKLKSTAEALKAVSEAIKALTGVTWDTGMGNLLSFGTGIKSTMNALKMAKTEIINAVPILNSFSGMPTIDTSVGTKLKNTAEALKNVSSAIKSLGDLNWNTNGLGGIFNGDVIGSLRTAKSQITQAAIILAGFNTIANVPPQASTKVKNVATGVKTVTSSLKTLNGITTTGINFTNIVPTLQKARTALGQASVYIAGLNTISNIPTTVNTKLKKLTTILPQVRTAAGALKGIPTVANTANIKKAVSAIKQTASELAGLNNLKSVQSGNALNSIRNALNQISGILKTSTGQMRTGGVSVGQAISQGIRAGLGNLAGVITPIFLSAMNSLVGQATSKGNQVGAGVKNGFSAGIKGMAQAAATEVATALSNITSKKSQFYTAGSELGAASAQGYKDGGGIASPGIIARSALGEVNYALQFFSSGESKLYTAAQRMGKSAALGYKSTNFSSLLTNNGLGKSFGTSTLNSIKDANKTFKPSVPQKNVSIQVGEGAVQLDARNLTTRESQQVMINAMEGFKAVKDVTV